MGTERTALGKATLIILNIGFAAILFVCLAGLLVVGFAPFELYSSSMKGLVMLICLIIFAIVGYVAFLYWNAFRKNNPQKINTVSTVIFVINLIFFCIFALSADVVKRFDINSYTKITNDFDMTGTMIGMITSLVALGIIMSEVKIHKKGRISRVMKFAWIPVLAVMVYSFVSIFSAGWISTLSAATIIGIEVSLCMHIGVVLISCWIANQDRFYAVKSVTQKPVLNGQNSAGESLDFESR